MPSREPELYKDKIEVSLDGRQIFYLFFGGAVIVGMVFVLGVMVGRRVEARGHLDRAETATTSDPLAALDRLERSDQLSFHGALTGSEAPTDVEKAIGELEKRRATGRLDAKPAPAATPEVHLVKADAKPEKADAKPEKADAKPEKADAKPEKADAKPEKADAKPEKRAEKADAKPENKANKVEAKADRAESVLASEADKPRADKHDGDKKSKKHEDGEPRAEPRSDRSDAQKSDRSDKPVTRPEARVEARVEPRSDARDGKDRRYTLQLSSFQDKAEAEAFVTAMKSAGYQPYVTEADVGGKAFYRVRLGRYRSADAASDAKAEYEKTVRKTAQIMRM